MLKPIPEGRQNETAFQSWTRKARHWGKGVLESIPGRAPTWVRCPESLQIDTHNYCNLWAGGAAGCEYCNVKKGGSFRIPRGRMPTEGVKYIIDYWGRFPEMKIIAMFMDGEPTLDKRLTEFFDYTTQHSQAYNLLDTNGTVYENRRLLIHPNLKVVRFTISAATPDTYLKVHGRPLFEKALKTVDWFQEHRLPHQNIVFHFIVTKNNEHEIEAWIDRFEGYLRKVFPLHRMAGLQLNSEESLGSNSDFIQSVSQSLEEWKKTRPLLIYPDGSRERHIIPRYQTCQGMSFAVQWDGLIRHCTDAPPSYNYGHCYDVDMLEAWHQRNWARATNPACLGCNAKRPDWSQILQKVL